MIYLLFLQVDAMDYTPKAYTTISGKQTHAKRKPCNKINYSIGGGGIGNSSMERDVDLNALNAECEANRMEYLNQGMNQIKKDSKFCIKSKTNKRIFDIINNKSHDGDTAAEVLQIIINEYLQYILEKMLPYMLNDAKEVFKFDDTDIQNIEKQSDPQKRLKKLNSLIDNSDQDIKRLIFQKKYDKFYIEQCNKNVYKLFLPKHDFADFDEIEKYIQENSSGNNIDKHWLNNKKIKTQLAKSTIYKYMNDFLSQFMKDYDNERLNKNIQSSLDRIYSTLQDKNASLLQKGEMIYHELIDIILNKEYLLIMKTLFKNKTIKSQLLDNEPYLDDIDIDVKSIIKHDIKVFIINMFINDILRNIFLGYDVPVSSSKIKEFLNNKDNFKQIISDMENYFDSDDFTKRKQQAIQYEKDDMEKKQELEQIEQQKQELEQIAQQKQELERKISRRNQRITKYKTKIQKLEAEIQELQAENDSLIIE